MQASRELARNAMLYTDKQYHKRIGCLILAYMISLKQHIQGERENTEIAPYFASQEETERIQKLKNRPAYIAHLLHALLHEAVEHKYTDPVRSSAHETALEGNIQELSEGGAACERIVKQPVPLSYTRHASRFLSLYMLALPMALIPLLGWTTVPAMVFVSWSFVSIKGIL